MNRTVVVSAIAIALLGSGASLAQAQQPAQQMQPDVASFFVADNANGTGNLGGLTGADQMCQTQAQQLGGKAATRTWHAYLSQDQRNNQPRVNARGRIGPGPWFNVKGQLIASNVGDLHGDNARDRNNVQRLTALDVKGNEIPGVTAPPGGNQHDIDDGFGFRWPGIHRWARSYLQQLDVGPDDLGAAEPERPSGACPCHARPQRSVGRREYVLEFSAYEPRLHQAVAHQHRRRRQVLLLRYQLMCFAPPLIYAAAHFHSST